MWSLTTDDNDRRHIIFIHTRSLQFKMSSFFTVFMLQSEKQYIAAFFKLRQKLQRLYILFLGIIV